MLQGKTRSQNDSPGRARPSTIAAGGWLWLAALVIGMAACAPTTAQIKQYTTQDSAAELSAGQEFQIVLESNATTGYSWQLTQPLDENIVQFVKSEYVAPTPEKEVVGAGGKEIWTFKALASGKIEIALQYVRSWEKPLVPAQSHVFAVTVR